MKELNRDDPSDESWKFWLAENATRFHLFARQCTRSDHDAQDVLQDSLVESWRRSGHKIPDDALVITTIRRRAMDLGRKTTRRGVREDAYLVSKDEVWFQSDTENKEIAGIVQSHLEKLKPNLREVLMLKIWSDLTFDQIGKSLGISINTAASRYRYGLEQLRRSLKGVLT